MLERNDPLFFIIHVGLSNYIVFDVSNVISYNEIDRTRTRSLCKGLVDASVLY